MKITCQCGYLIPDQTDALPNKAHLIPDQSWLGLLDSINGIIARAAEGKMPLDAARQAAMTEIIRTSRQAYQCPSCGALLVDGPQRTISFFLPDNDADSAIFRR